MVSNTEIKVIMRSGHSFLESMWGEEGRIKEIIVKQILNFIYLSPNAMVQNVVVIVEKGKKTLIHDGLLSGKGGNSMWIIKGR